MEATIVEHTTKRNVTREDEVRRDLQVTRDLLVDLRTQKRELEVRIKALVAEERLQRRVVAVYDRAAQPPKPRGPRKAKVAA